MKKKVVYLAPANSPHTFQWIKAFKDEFDILLISFYEPTNLRELDGVKFRLIRSKISNKLKYLFEVWEIQRVISEFSPEIVHAHYGSSNGVILGFLRGSFKRITTFWGSDFYQARKNPLHRLLIDWAIKKQDYINVPNEDMAESMLKHIGPKGKVLTFQYGIDTKYIDQIAEAMPVVPKESSKIRLISFRHWAPIYNIDKIILGFKEAALKNGDIELILIGNGSQSEKEKIYRLVGEHPRIKVIGMVSKKELLEWALSSQVSFSLPDSDGLSLSVLEAAYCGCYLLLSNIPPNIEVLKFCSGEVIGDLSPGKIGEEILKSIQNIGENLDLSKGRSYILDKADYRTNMNKMRQVYLD